MSDVKLSLTREEAEQIHYFVDSAVGHKVGHGEKLKADDPLRTGRDKLEKALGFDKIPGN